MNGKSSFDKCLVYIGAQLESGSKNLRGQSRKRIEPSVAISRQTGAGGIPIAEHLAEYLQSHGPQTQRPWTVFDKNLVQQVLTDHNLPQEIARYMPEDRVSQISDMVEEVLGLHPASWTLLWQTTETILRLAALGNVILVGRAANVITGQLDNVFHVRLVGSETERVKLVEEFYHLNHRAALEFMRKEDRGRQRYLKRYFHRDIDDPLLYHLIINTDRISYEDATQLIGDSVLHKFY
jgi:Cytidylate kinase-like family